MGESIDEFAGIRVRMRTDSCAMSTEDRPRTLGAVLARSINVLAVRWHLVRADKADLVPSISAMRRSKATQPSPSTPMMMAIPVGSGAASSPEALWHERVARHSRDSTRHRAPLTNPVQTTDYHLN